MDTTTEPSHHVSAFIPATTGITTNHGNMPATSQQAANANSKGLTIAEVAKRVGLSYETTARLMEHHGYVEMSLFGSVEQQRRLVTMAVMQAGYGHNVDPSHKRSRRLDGVSKAVPFAVFNPSSIDDLIWTFGLDVIAATLDGLPGKKAKLGFLLRDHGYLPDDEVARLAGYDRSGVRKARHRAATVSDIAA